MDEQEPDWPAKQHLDWCKTRALEYLDRGDLPNAVSSMTSDLNKHPETRMSADSIRQTMGIRYAMEGDERGVRRWIEGFKVV